MTIGRPKKAIYSFACMTKGKNNVDPKELPKNSYNKPPKQVKSSEPVEPKDLTPIVEGRVTRRKKPMLHRFTEYFLGGSPKAAGQYVVLEVMLPAAKDMISASIGQGIDQMLWGEVRSSSARRPNRGNVGTANFVNYGGSIYGGNKPSNARRQEEPPRRPRSSKDLDAIVLETKIEAESVIDRLYELMSTYDAVSVADLYELLNIPVTTVDHKWGWLHLSGASAVRVRGGYMLDLPSIEPIDD